MKNHKDTNIKTRPCRACGGERWRMRRFGFDGENFTDCEYETCAFCRGAGFVLRVQQAAEPVAN